MISRAELIRKTKDILREYALQPNKNLGQNFCVEPAIIELIYSTLVDLHPTKILEVGGGLGTLSEKLATLDIPLTIVEKDSNLAVLLEQKFQSKKVKILNMDVLELDHKSLLDCDVIIGNIPYEISSPLLFKIWANKSPKNIFPNIILTIQKEFALRIVAKPETQDYGRLSAMTQLFSEPSVLKIYPPSAFYPVPKVAHGVVHLIPRIEIPEAVFSDSFGKFMIGLFNRKNKKVINSLEPLIKKYKSKELETSLRENELFLKRVRDITPIQCVELFTIWNNERNKIN